MSFRNLLIIILMSNIGAFGLDGSFELNQMQKITVMASQAKPYVYQDKQSFRGLDVDIIENFAKKYHLKIEYVSANAPLKKVFSDEDLFNNFSRSVAFSKIDIFIGALEENLLTNKYLLASHSYYHEHIIWCTQKSQPIPLWQNIFHLCRDPLVYIILTAEGLIIFCLGYITQIFERQRKWDWHEFTIQGFCCALGFTCTFNPKISVARMGFLSALLAFIIFDCVLSTALMQMAITPILNPQIQSVQQLIGGNFKLIGDQFVFQKLLQQKEIHTVMSNFEAVEQPDQYFSKLQSNDRLAIAIPRELSLFRTQTGNIEFDSHKNAYCFKYPNKIYEYSLSMLTQKDFPFKNELNRFIQRAIEGGLIVKWLKQYQLDEKEKPHVQFTTVTMGTFRVEIAIFLCMMAFAFMNVIIEKFVHKKTRSPNSKRLWRYVEMAVDPDRHFLLENLDWAT